MDKFQIRPTWTCEIMGFEQGEEWSILGSKHVFVTIDQKLSSSWIIQWRFHVIYKVRKVKVLELLDEGVTLQIKKVEGKNGIPHKEFSGERRPRGNLPWAPKMMLSFQGSSAGYKHGKGEIGINVYHHNNWINAGIIVLIWERLLNKIKLNTKIIQSLIRKQMSSSTPNWFNSI